MSKLIVTCDDCGLSEGINLATADLYENGYVTAATVMTNFPAARHAIDLLSSYSSLDVGVHLNLTDGFPLTRIEAASDLTYEDGSFKARPLLFIQALIARQSFLELVEAELTKQIEFFLDSGVQPQHLTTHIHFHWFPALRKIVYDLAGRYDIRWIRNNELRRAIVPFNMFLPEQIETENTAELENVPSPDYLIVLQYWMKYGAPEKLLGRLLSLQGAIELVIHPCLEEDLTYPQEIQYQPSERYEEMQYFMEFAQLMRNEAADAIQLSPGL